MAINGSIIIIKHNAKTLFLNEGTGYIHNLKELYGIKLYENGSYLTLEKVLNNISEKFSISSDVLMANLLNTLKSKLNITFTANAIKYKKLDILCEELKDIAQPVLQGKDLSVKDLIASFILNNTFLTRLITEDLHIVVEKNNNIYDKFHIYNKSGKFGFSKGGKKNHETPFETIQREVYEELRYDLSVLGPYQQININLLESIMSIQNNIVYELMDNDRNVLIEGYAIFYLQLDDSGAGNLLRNYNTDANVKRVSEIFEPSFHDTIHLNLNKKTLLTINKFNELIESIIPILESQRKEINEELNSLNKDNLEGKKNIYNKYTELRRKIKHILTLLIKNHNDYPKDLLTIFKKAKSSRDTISLVGFKRDREEKYLKYKAKYLALKKLLNL